MSDPTSHPTSRPGTPPTPPAPSGPPSTSPSTSPPAPRRLARLARRVSTETTGGVLLLTAAALGLAWANSPWRETYRAISTTVVGPAAWHLDLPLATWAADGLLAVFFFVVGLELKHELTVGSLRDVRRAAVPALAAIGGMVTPAAVYVTVVLLAGDRSALPGWAIPTATDIAFALAVLAVFGRGLPAALRTFLLTLAVVDDLLAIAVIAIFYTDTLRLPYLGLALLGVAGFAAAVRLLPARSPILPLIAVVTWAFMHSSGVHATVAGVLLGLTVPAVTVGDGPRSRTSRYEHALRPWSAGVALPVFAFFAAGVTLVDGDGPGGVLTRPVVLAIVAGLVLGKLVGVLGTTALLTAVTPLRLPPGLSLRTLLPVGLLAGIGFTVSLLIAELSFADGHHAAGAKIAVLAGSVIAATAAAVTLRRAARGRTASDDDPVHGAGV